MVNLRKLVVKSIMERENQTTPEELLLPEELPITKRGVIPKEEATKEAP